jgi:hypothetical protein
MGANMEDGIWHSWPGEWEDFHEPLPKHDPAWGLVITSLAIGTWACTIAAVIFVINLGLPH